MNDPISMRWVADRSYRKQTATDRHWGEIVRLIEQGAHSTDVLQRMKEKYPDETFSRCTLYDRAKQRGVQISKANTALNALKREPKVETENPVWTLAFSRRWV